MLVGKSITMKNRVTFFLTACLSIILLSSFGSKNYSVSVTDGTVVVKMHSPTRGMAGVDRISYDGFTYDDVEKAVFDGIRRRSYNGNYTITVILQFKDSYGRYYDGPPVNVGTLNGSQVKQYASFKNFSGSTQIYRAFPWNHRYN